MDIEGKQMQPIPLPTALHCQMKNTLYSPNSNEDEAVKALEEELEDAVARYAEDNLLVARVRNILPSRSENYFLKVCSGVGAPMVLITK